MRIAIPLAVAGLLLVSACRGGGDTLPGGTPTAIPTATPLATVPTPTLVTSAATPPPATGSTETSYVVVAGDVLGLIAERFGVPAAAIVEANNLSGSDIFIGQKLRIPRPAATTGGVPATPSATPTPSTAGVSTYTVEAGDSAFGIALQFDTTLEALERANGVAPGGLDHLRLGQVLKLPPPGQR